MSLSNPKVSSKGQKKNRKRLYSFPIKLRLQRRLVQNIGNLERRKHLLDRETKKSTQKRSELQHSSDEHKCVGNHKECCVQEKNTDKRKRHDKLPCTDKTKEKTAAKKARDIQQSFGDAMRLILKMDLSWKCMYVLNQ